MNALLFILFAFSPVLAATPYCYNGCLRCSRIGICLLCDTRNFYIQKGFGCVLSKIPNCATTVNGKNCLYCNSGYYVDSVTKNCVAATFNITGCKIYRSANECMYCDALKYNRTATECVSVEKEISSCLYYMGPNKCALCDKSELTNNGTTCTAPPLAINCAYYSGSLSCDSCINGYSLLRNKYILDLQNDMKFQEAFLYNTTLNEIKYGFIADQKSNVCYKSVPHCLKQSTYITCETCEDNYFVSSTGSCVPNPNEKINNCIKYKSASECVYCSNGYYLKTATNCAAQKAIAYCKTYSTTTANVCSRCNQGFYYNSLSQTCDSISEKVLNCQTYKYNEQKCEECQTNYQLSPNFLTCFSNIPRCLEYLFFETGSEITLLCKKCLPGFYIRTQVINSKMVTNCQLPVLSLEGCNSYQSETQCFECKDKYYLANFKCYAHQASIMANLSCKNFSTTLINQCQTCNDSQFLFQLFNFCESVPTANILANCQVYDTTGTCYQCSDAYYLTTVKEVLTCVKTTIEGCIKVDRTTNKCLVCDLTKLLAPDLNQVNNKCTRIPSFFTDSCADLKNNLEVDEISCSTCNVPLYPFTMENDAYGVCIPISELKDFQYKLTDNDQTKLDSCKSFDFLTKKCLICNQDSSKPYVQSDTGYCTSICQNDELILTFSFKDYLPNAFMVCTGAGLLHYVGDNIEYCSRADYDVSTVVTKPSELNIPQMCALCRDGYLPMVANSDKWSYTYFLKSPNKISANLASNTFYSQFNKIPLYNTCLPWFNTNDINFFPYNYGTPWVDNSGTNIPNINTAYLKNNPNFFSLCRALISFTNSTSAKFYACGSCHFGANGLVVRPSGATITNTNFAFDFIHTCKSMPECDPEVYYNGLGNHDSGAYLDYYVSCHKCVDSNQVVTFVSRRAWKIPGTNKTPDDLTPTTGIMPNVVCAQKGVIDTNVPSFPSNCAVQQVLTTKKLSVYGDVNIPPNPMCVACRPGYRATLSSSKIEGKDYRYIMTCELITQCAKSDTFNKCTKCNTGYVLLYSSDLPTKSSYEKCVLNSIDRCLIGEEGGVCRECELGYILNKEGICDSIRMENCESFGTINSYTTAYEYLTKNPFGQGCLACTEDAFSVRFRFIPTRCVTNKAVASTAIGAKHVVANCQRYSYSKDQGLICSLCTNGYYPTSDYKQCISEAIPNCAIYAPDPNGGYYCVQCKNEYYYDNRLCYLGQIKACLVYVDKNNCMTCKSGHVATQINGAQYTICFDVTGSVKNCASYDINQAYKGRLTCTSCVKNSYPYLFNLAIKTCATFYSINNCLSYDLGSTFASSTFQCKKCTEIYYARTDVFPSRCELRAKYPVTNCYIYDQLMDKCQSCLEGFFISADGLTCTLNPIGIQGCLRYKSLQECLICSANYYLQNKICVEIPTEKKIENCFNYSPDMVCIKCAKTFRLINGNCVSAEIANCVEVGFDGNCLKCRVGYGFFGTSCELLTISNCVKFESLTNCIECETNYYLTSGRCFEAPPIAQCAAYSGKNVCSRCNDGYIKENDGSACIALTEDVKEYVNPICSQFSRSNVCLVCEAGYYFSSTSPAECLKCKVDNCRYCNFSQPDECIVCLSGTYMSTNMTCLPNAVSSNGTNTTTTYLSDYYLEN